MKLFLHIGMPKAGSTALQQTLGAAAADLEPKGICFPVGHGLPKNHNMLVGGFLEHEKLPRLFRQIYANDDRRMRRDFRNFMAGLLARIATSKAHTIVLSGEMLFRKMGPRKIAALRDMLQPFADQITVMAYVRSPAQFYMSQVQQVLKASHKIVEPGPRLYRGPLESYEALTDDIRVVPYAREGLYGGDIARDFLHRLSPKLGDILRDEQICQSNQTISAEGIDILQKYRKYGHPEENGTFTPDTGEVINLIAEAEAEIGGFTKPVVHEHVRDYLSCASVDLLWLRDRHGITFGDIDYDRITDRLSPPSPPDEILDICQLDQNLRDRLAVTVMHRLAERATEGRKVRFKTSIKRRR
jgi:hypothetical protein